MLRQDSRKGFARGRVPFQVIVLLGLGLVVGISSIWISPLAFLGGVIVAVFMYAIVKRPEMGLLAILVATSSIVFEDQLPLVPIGVGSLQIPDLVLLFLLGLLITRRVLKPGLGTVGTPLDRPILLFYGLALLSTIFGLFQSSVGIELARRAIRVLSYYLTFFVVTNLVRERRQLNLLLNGFFLLATIVATAMIMQYFLGASLPFLPGRVETLTTQGTVYEDIARIIPPGWSIITASGVAIFCTLVQAKAKRPAFLRMLQLVLLGIAIAITFIRTYWITLAFVLFLAAYLVRRRERRRLLQWSIVVFGFLLVFILYGIGEPQSQIGKFVGATYARIETLWSKATISETSLQWRYVETEYALRSIAAHPFLGLGFGAQYRPYDSRIDYQGMAGGNLRDYIHNGHLWILMDSGLLGYLAFVGLSLTFLVHGLRSWRTVASDWYRGIVLGFTLVYLAALIGAITAPTFTVWSWTPVIGIIMGINEVILTKSTREASVG